MANTRAAAAVLNGTYTCPEGTDEGTRDLFDEIAHLRSMVPKDSVSTTISGKRWQQRWRKAKEKTSSSESGIHFGHYIAGVQSNVIAQHDAIKTTLCNKWGIYPWIDGAEECRVCWRRSLAVASLKNSGRSS